MCRPLILNKAKVVLAPASSAYRHSLKEVLASAAISAQIKVLQSPFYQWKVNPVIIF